MSKVISVIFIATIILISTSVLSEEKPSSDLEKLREKADDVLKQTNVSARSDIDVVFQLIDRLIEENQKDEAERYIIKGLQHFPWNLKYQMIYAEMLDKKGKKEEAKEKASLVYQYAETDELLILASKFLNKDPLPEFSKISTLPGTDHCVVLIPFMESDKWLIMRIKEKLSTTLGIPVYIQTINTTYPPFSRDRRQVAINELRNMFTQNMNDVKITKAMKELRLTKKDLEKTDNILKLMKYFLKDSGSEAIKDFDERMEELKGKYPQWNSDQLLTILFRAVKPYRRKNVAYLAVTSVDIYAKDYNFLFGWANRSGGVMSYHRFTSQFNNEAPNRERLLKRIFMQSLSSIGHIYGLKRCINPKCARAYPHSLAEHDAKDGTLCSQCRNGFKEIFGKKNQP